MTALMGPRMALCHSCLPVFMVLDQQQPRNGLIKDGNPLMMSASTTPTSRMNEYCGVSFSLLTNIITYDIR